MTTINWGDVPTWVTAVAAVAAGAYGALQVRQIKFQNRESRERSQEEAQRYHRLSREGVAASWRAPRVPKSAGNDGRALWEYRFDVQNPGRLPITDVRVKIEFALDVQRVHHDGHTGSSTRTLHLDTAVIVGGGSRSWDRKLRMDYGEARHALRKTRTTVTFIDEDGHEFATVWPRHRAPLPDEGATAAAPT